MILAGLEVGEFHLEDISIIQILKSGTSYVCLFLDKKEYGKYQLYK